MSTSWPSLLIHPLSFVSSQGSRCNEPCSEGLWGRHCNQTCFKHCPNSDTCLRETGACVCRPGYWGVTCQNSECWQTAQIWWDQIRNVLDLLLSACPPWLTLYLSSPRMPSRYVWRPVQHVMSVLQPVVPLPPCDRRVRLPSRTHRSQLRSRLASTSMIVHARSNHHFIYKSQS